MAKGDAADRLTQLRKAKDFSPVWSNHALLERLPEYGFDMLSIERVVRSGRISSPEMNANGLETVHVGGTVDEQLVDVVVCPRVVDDLEVAVIVTLKPRPRR